MKDALLSLSCFDLLAVINDFTKTPTDRYKKHESAPLKNFLQVYSAIDIQRAMPDVISTVFSSQNRIEFNGEIETILQLIRNEAIDATHSSFGDLEFLHSVVAKALWQYKLDLDPNLEGFAKEFDRIDDKEERLRIISRLKLPKM